MSQYLGFVFKKKDAQDIQFNGSYFSTTPARILSDEDIFPYTDKEVKITEEDLNQKVLLIERKLFSFKEYCQEQLRQKNHLETLLIKAVNETAYNKISEDIKEIKSSLSIWNEDIEEWTSYKEFINLLISLLEDNKDWELYYSNC